MLDGSVLKDGCELAVGSVTWEGCVLADGWLLGDSFIDGSVLTDGCELTVGAGEGSALGKMLGDELWDGNKLG